MVSWKHFNLKCALMTISKFLKKHFKISSFSFQKDPLDVTPPKTHQDTPENTPLATGSATGSATPSATPSASPDSSPRLVIDEDSFSPELPNMTSPGIEPLNLSKRNRRFT